MNNVQAIKIYEININCAETIFLCYCTFSNIPSNIKKEKKNEKYPVNK